MTNGIHSQHYAFSDETGVDFGPHADSLQRVDIYTGIRVNYGHALLIVDSLNNANIPFLTHPALDTKEKFRLRFFAWLEIPNNIDSLSCEERRELTDPIYLDFKDHFYREFADYDSSNIWIFSMMPGYVDVSIFMESMEFDFSRLENFNIHFDYKPIIRPRLFDFTIIDRQ